MIELTATTRKWGNSLGVRIPKSIIEDAHIKEDQVVHLLIVPKKIKIAKLFGTFKKTKSTQQIKDEFRKELY